MFNETDINISLNPSADKLSVAGLYAQNSAISQDNRDTPKVNIIQNI